MKILKNSFIVIIIFLSSFCVANADILLIANNSVTEADISKGDIKRIFLGKKRMWTDQQKISPVTLINGPVHEGFVSAFINKTPITFSTFWKRVIVTGTGIPPKSFKSETDLVKYVSATKGAVGYISADTSHKGVKVLSVKH